MFEVKDKQGRVVGYGTESTDPQKDHWADLWKDLGHSPQEPEREPEKTDS
jgi:hypothetical protein